MNRNRIGGNWTQMKAKAKEKWAKVTNHDQAHVAGQHDPLTGKSREGHGVGKEKAEKEVDIYAGWL